MVDTYTFYGSPASFKSILVKIEQYLTKKLQYTIKHSEEGEDILVYCNNGNCKGTLRINHPKPEKNIEWYQHGLQRMSIKWDGYDTDCKEIVLFLKKVSQIFTPEEEKRLYQYTPLLDSLISSKYLKKDTLKNTIVIFREHSLISVYNIFHIFSKMGMKPENMVYYSKGDRCRNISRIEASFRDKGFGVKILSPFESVSPTGKTEDERILPDAAKRVEQELTHYFKRARKEKKKIVIFDDGGLLITTVIELFAKEYNDVIAGFIETTKGGMHAIESRKKLDVTVVNLANSVIKKLMSSVIGHSIVHRLKQMIPHIGLQNKNAVVVGYGNLGKTIAKDLRNQGMSVYVCDIDDTRAYEALADGFPTSKNIKRLFKDYNPLLVMGCTGLDALTFENLSVLEHDTYIATVSSKEIKQSYAQFDKTCKRTFIDNYARIYTLPKGNTITILGNGASLNLYNGEGAVHADYQPFLAAMIETIAYCAIHGPIKSKNGLDTHIANEITIKANILGKYLELSKSLIL